MRGFVNSMVLFFFLVAPSFGITLDIKPDSNISVTGNEKEALKQYLVDRYRFHIKDEGALKVVKENRTLANAYLKEYGLSPEDKDYLKVVAERILAEKYVKLLQRKVSIPKKVVYSYYKDNLDKFKLSDKVDIVAFYFPSPEDAMKFYLSFKDKTFNEMQQYAKEHNISQKRFENRKVEGLHAYIQKYIKSEKAGYLIPPYLTADKNIVFYVASYKPQKGYRDFESVEKEIEKYLRNQTFARMRREVLKKFHVDEQ